AMVDLDHDGTLDPIVAKDEHEGGARPNFTIFAGPGRPLHAVGSNDGDVALARVQPAAIDGIVVVALRTSATPRTLYRCVGGGATWTSCPAAARAQRLDDALAAADALVDHPAQLLADREQLGDLLALLDVPAARKAALLGQADASSASQLIARYLRARAAAAP